MQACGDWFLRHQGVTTGMERQEGGCGAGPIAGRVRAGSGRLVLAVPGKSGESGKAHAQAARPVEVKLPVLPTSSRPSLTWQFSSINSALDTPIALLLRILAFCLFFSIFLLLRLRDTPRRIGVGSGRPDALAKAPQCCPRLSQPISAGLRGTDSGQAPSLANGAITSLAVPCPPPPEAVRRIITCASNRSNTTHDARSGMHGMDGR